MRNGLSKRRAAEVGGLAYLKQESPNNMCNSENCFLLSGVFHWTSCEEKQGDMIVASKQAFSIVLQNQGLINTFKQTKYHALG